MSTPIGGQTKNLLHSVNQSYCVFFLCPILCPSQLTEPGQCDSNKIDFVQILFVIIFFLLICLYHIISLSFLPLC